MRDFFRPRRLSLAHLGLAWAAALSAWALLRAFLAASFQQAWIGPGLLALLALLMALAWITVEEPRLAQGGAPTLGRWAAALLALPAGQALLYADMPGKESVAALGFGLLLLGAALVWPRGRGRTLAMASAGALMLLGFFTWLRRESVPWDLFQGPWRGQWGMLLFWMLLAVGLAGLAWQASRPRLSLAGAPLSRRAEVWGLASVMLLGAGLRFWHPAGLPADYWYDEVNLARAIQDRVLAAGQAPLYVTEQVENPGAWLWVGAAVFRVFGVSLDTLRLASGAFGLLAVLPCWALARLWLGARWALVAALVFAGMRWVLIPQRIAFMSGFALFWMLAAFWGLWWAALRSEQDRSELRTVRRSWASRSLGVGWWRWALAGLLLGANLHTYTPARFVPLIAAVFFLLQALPWFRAQGPRLGWRPAAALAAGFLVSAGPMLWYIANHWTDYALRARQVSLFADVAKSGRPLLPELWGTLTKHGLMLHYRGDFNARHNLHFLPHVDFVTACGLALALPLMLGQAWRDARARFLLLWIAAMLAAGIFTLPVEAPQGHRTVLAAPALALALGLCLPPLLAPLRAALGGAWPQTAGAVGAVLLFSVFSFNAWELLRVWPASAATFRSFSPRASAVMRRVEASRPGTVVLSSSLPAEYQFHGYEWGVFVRFALRQQGRPWGTLQPGTPVPPREGGQATHSVLLIWGESDRAITAAFEQQFPGLAPHREPQPHPSAGEPAYLYLSAEVPYDRVPPRPNQGALPLLFRLEP